MTGEAQADPQVSPQVEPRVTSQVETKVATVDTNSAKDVVRDGDSSARAVASEVPSTVAVPTEPAPAVPETSQAATAAQELHNKINDMQQLFEQRKKMITNSGAPPTQN